MSASLAEIEQKVFEGERLTFDEGVFLDREAPLLELGRLANHVRERRHGNVAYYNTNIHLNPTNVCIYRCKFCAFRSDLRDEKSYVFDEKMVHERVAEAKERGATEIHVVGGLHHKKKFDWYLDVLRWIRDAWPELHIKAYTPVEVHWFSHMTKKPYDWVMEQLIDAGLGSLPGGGAEIFDEQIRKQLCEHKADSGQWFDIHDTAHRLGLRSNATMLYGHYDQAEHRVDHLLRLRAQQDKSNARGDAGFQTLIPLAFHPDNTRIDDLAKPTGMMDLRMIALGRLMLDNFDHIKAYWIMLGESIAQTALSFGADDIDGTVVHENIYHDAGAETPEGLTVEQLHHMIREAGREPYERDTLYREVHRDPANPNLWTIGDPIGSLAAV
ncbi:MAG: aminofutalosine synthase MqnE [Planctomycetota bacterium]